MSTSTNYAPICAINWVAPEPIYGVIICIPKIDSKQSIGFKITDDCREICNYVNHPNSLCRFKLFTTAYDAEDWLCSQLSFEEQFIFHLADGEQIGIGFWYTREDIT